MCDLSDSIQITIPAVSQHLHKLKDCNLIQSQRQTIFYSLKQISYIFLSLCLNALQL
ncbi:ArsR family transcriptional regulator [Cnuella takakiae]|uniref:ArsR family transcriptional regulator n=1 Tax=Cnuella takakiae TaxID=1302690 RepID=UPI001FE477FE|nr:ArsR family transcriptional regulator [Cnuella takakiae]